MKLSEFDYNLPEERIAKFPPEIRGTTNLMVLDRGDSSIVHRKYSDIVEYIKPGDILVLNNTKVEKVRVFFTNQTNSKRIEALFLNKVYRGGDLNTEYWECILGRAKNVREGDILVSVESDGEIKVEGRIEDSIFLVTASIGVIDSIFEKEGHVPLPPYLRREDTKEDYVRYNTVFAKKTGSSAAPTSGLNFTPQMLELLKNKGVEIVEVSLNVGWGTFAPIRVDEIEKHKIHSEYIEVTQEVADKINEVISNGGDVWALGTTAARTLESVAESTEDGFRVKAFKGDTSIYIYPGYQWKVVKHLITNFHAPKSSLLVMIASLLGYDFMMDAYKEALEKEYNFLSYGDSMIIL